MSIWSSHGGRKLEELVSKTLKHLEIVRDEVKSLLEMTTLLLQDRVDDAVNVFTHINELEHKADELKRDIMRELRMGFLHPLDREDILKLIITADDIAAYTKATGRRIVVLKRVGGRVPRRVLEKINEIVKESVTAVELLYNALSSLPSNIDESLTLIDRVEEIEEKIDDIRMEALEELYRVCRENLSIDCLLVKEIIDDAENISDRAEDTGDIIRIIATTYK